VGFRSFGNAPTTPHFVCIDGYWWHDDPDRQPCFSGRIYATMAQVEACFVGRTLARAEAVAALAPGARFKLFPIGCACGADHSKLASNLLRAHAQIAPAVKEQIASLNAVQIIRIAAVQRDTPDETERAQAERAAQMFLTRGRRARRRAEPASIAA